MYAEKCEHNYDWGFESDICTKCGAIRPGIDAPCEFLFPVVAKHIDGQYIKGGCLGLQDSERHIKALSLKSSKLAVNSA